MAYELIKTQKGVDMIVLDGYCFLKEKTVGKKTAWKCSEYKAWHCRARCHTVENEVVKQPVAHNHASDKGKILARKAIAIMKERAASSLETCDQIFATVTAEVPGVVSGQMPSVRNIKQAIQRIRRENKTTSFPMQNDLQDIVAVEDNFLEFDNDPSPNSMQDSDRLNITEAIVSKEELNGDVPFHEKFEEVFLEQSTNSERKGKRKNSPYNDEPLAALELRPPQHSCSQLLVRDEFSIYGEHIACKIRNLQNRRLQNIAEHKINNILFELDMGISDELDKLES